MSRLQRLEFACKHCQFQFDLQNSAWDTFCYEKAFFYLYDFVVIVA